MSTGHTWLHLYPAKILGLQDLEDHLAATMRDQVDQIRRDVYGSGGALDAKANISVAGDELTLVDDLEGYTPNGKRLLLDASDPEWGDVPFEDAGATVYHVAARHIDVPVEAQDGIDGRPHFSYHREMVGIIVNPATVAEDVGGGLLLTMTASLPQGMRWSTSAGTRPVIVWYEDVNGDPASKSTVLAIEEAELAHDGGAYTVTTANRFGQVTPSTVPARYKVAILGPAIFTAAELPGDYTDLYLPLGTVTSGVFDNSAAPLVNTLGDTITAFNVQHDNATGEHLDVTADSIEVGAPVGLPAVDPGDVAAQRVTTNVLLAKAAADGTAQIAVQQADGSSKVELRGGDPATAGGGGALHFPNPHLSTNNTARISTDIGGSVTLQLTNLDSDPASGLNLFVDGILRKDPTKTGIPFALQVDAATDEELQIQNLGAGALSLRILNGDVVMDAGDLVVNLGDILVPNGLVEANTFQGPGGVWSADPTGVVEGTQLRAPLFLCTPAASDLAYGYTSRVQFQVDFHPIQGGWTGLEAPGTVRPDYQTGAAPPYVRPSATGTNLTLRIPLTLPNWYRSSPAAQSDLFRIVQIQFRYRRANASDTVVFRIKRVRKDGTLGEVIVSTVTAAVSAVDTLGTTGVIDHNIDRLNFAYFLEVTLQANASVDDARIMNVLALFDKLGVE